MNKFLEHLSQRATRFTASALGFGSALALVLIWLLLGPMFHYSEDWQLVINTLTTIITFLMVFLIQRAQNKDVLALHLKLNELIASQQGASNRLLNVEERTEKELAAFKELHDQLPKDSIAAHSMEHAIKPELILPPQRND
jgi:low affinity Fe/Cu permease